MFDRNYRRICGWLIGVGIVGMLGVCPKAGYAATTDSNSVATLERYMMASSTKKIQYKKGKTKSVVSSKWKKAKNLSRTASSLIIRKRGWYSVLVTKNTGKKTVISIYLNKKNDEITCNTSVRQQEGYYAIVPKSNQTQAMEVQNSSLSKGGNISVWTRGDSACRSWKLEAAGGNNFRLKNVNSGLYLSDTVSGAKEGNAMQVALAEKDKAQIIRAYSAGSGYVYLKCTGTKKYLHVNRNNVEFAPRKKAKAWKFKLVNMKCPGSLVWIEGGKYPSALQEGSSFTLAGMMSSRYTMKKVIVSVVDESGNAKLSYSANPNRCFYDLKGADPKIIFGKLPVGQYFYRIAVKDATGKTLVWVNQPFSVVGNPTVMAPVGSASNLTLPYNPSLIQSVGHQSTGSALEKKACASYALAYCNAILNASAPSPHNYWSSSTDVNCVWSKGGYTCSSTGYGSELAVLQAAYTQILAGKPCILHVTGNTEQHWLCVIGYKNVTSLKSLTAANFVAIDPWDGNVITVSAKYKVKNTYRLATKS